MGILTLVEKYDIALSFIMGTENVDMVAEAKTREEIEQVMGNEVSSKMKGEVIESQIIKNIENKTTEELIEIYDQIHDKFRDKLKLNDNEMKSLYTLLEVSRELTKRESR